VKDFVCNLGDRMAIGGNSVNPIWATLRQLCRALSASLQMDHQGGACLSKREALTNGLVGGSE
jgi:hypothetical protein